MTTSSTWLNPRIWRSGRMDFYQDEALQAPAVYSEQEFQHIASHGFTGVWLRGRLAELMQSTVLPELNDPLRDQRIANLRTIIERGQRSNIGIWLYFNEPLAPKSDHPVFAAHPDIRGRSHEDATRHRHVTVLCTSTEKIQRFFREAVANVLAALPGLAGVILITASEYPTHCWSKVSCRNQPVEQAKKQVACPRCVDRQQAGIVTELITTWRDAAAQCIPSPRVLAWNWSWSMWYEDPQEQVLKQLPPGVELLVDWERGDERIWRDRSIKIDEYALGYIGPSPRFRLTADYAAKRHIPVHAKLQIGTTHEIATVPNIPVIGNLHGKFVGLTKQQVAGTMASWNFGLNLTLNTYAMHLFGQDPQRYADRDAFFSDLARKYLGIDDAAPLACAWDGFADALTEYPFSIPMLYASPVNYAPAFPLRLEYRGVKVGPSWIVHEWGDDVSNCIKPFSLDDVADGLRDFASKWQAALPGYVAALARGRERTRCEEERRTAQMIGLQVRSAANVFAWSRWRGEGRTALDAEGRAIVEYELATITAALPLVDADERFGFHQECQHRWYDGPSIRKKIEELKALL